MEPAPPVPPNDHFNDVRDVHTQPDVPLKVVGPNNDSTTLEPSSLNSELIHRAPKENDSAPPAHRFECNICLDTASEPVVTRCGHLFDWPCLYRWLQTHPSCPVCKAGVTRDMLIPVYARGAERKDPRESVPERPRAQPQPPPPSRPQVQQMPPWQMQFAFGGPFGMMTSLFGFHAHVGHFPMAYRTDGYGFMGGQNHNGQREEPDAQTALAHALLLLGLLLLLLVAVL